MRLKATEHQEQAAVVAYCRLNKIRIFAIPNGAVLGGRNKYALLNKLKAEGLENGVPDLFIPIEQYHPLPGVASERLPIRIHYCGLFIEMKSATGKLTLEQKEWIETLSSNGYKVLICRSAEEAIGNIKEYLGMK